MLSSRSPMEPAGNAPADQLIPTGRAAEAPGRLSRRRDRRKAEIVRVAINMLATSGYTGMSLEDVAERTNIAKATLYHYFTSKDELVSEALEALTIGVLQQLEAARAAAQDGTSREQLQALVREQLRVLIEEYPEVGTIFAWQTPWPAAHDEARKSMRRRHDAIFRAVVDAGIDDGTLDCEDPDVALQCLHGVMNNVSLWVGQLKDRAEASRAREAVVSAVMRIFAADEPH